MELTAPLIEALSKLSFEVIALGILGYIIHQILKMMGLMRVSMDKVSERMQDIAEKLGKVECKAVPCDARFVVQPIRNHK